jgi:CAAX protease family protein
MKAMSIPSKSIVFLALAFAISWGVVAVGWFTGAAHSAQSAILTMALMMLGPSIAALICAIAFEKGRRREALGLRWTPNWWWAAAWAIALAIAFGASLVTVLARHAAFVDIGANYLNQVRAAAPGQAAQLDVASRVPGLGWIIVAQAAILGALINTPLLVISEELGWRGYLYDLWRRFGFVRYSMLTGAVWGLWHAPAIYLFGLNYPDNRFIGVPLFMVFCVLFAFPFTLLRDRGKSVIAPAILHGTTNAVGGLAALGLSAMAFPWNGIVGIGGFVVLALVAAASWAIGGRAPASGLAPEATQA